jgi:hypothetical protein
MCACKSMYLRVSLHACVSCMHVSVYVDKCEYAHV